MEEFSLEKYLENPNRKVVTRDGRSARIICTNKIDSTTPIIALIYKGAEEVIQLYTKEGKIISKYPCFEYDLFFAPEKKDGWINIYRDIILGGVYYDTIYPSEEDAKENACSGAIATVKIEWEE